MNATPTERIADRLGHLRHLYGGFDVRQTTLTVTPAEFATVRDRGGRTTVRVRVTGSEGVLAVADGGSWALPSGEVDDTSLIDGAGRVVRQETGVSCRLVDVDQVDVVCVRHDGAEDPVWHLGVLFEAEYESGRPVPTAAWRGPELGRTTLAGPPAGP